MLLVTIVFLLLMILGMPVAFAIGISGFVFFLQQPTLSFTMPVQLVLTQTQSFVLLAIPLFVFAGNLLNETGITHRLMKLASVLAGHMRAGLAQVNMVLATMLGGITSSAIGDATMLGRVLGPGMIEKGYSRGFAAGVIGTSSMITTMIPPGIGLVLYGSIGEVSIGRLFAAGILPGLLMMVLLMVAVSVTARSKGYQPERAKVAPPKEIWTTFIDCIWAFLFPILLLAGLRTGIFTPSEAGAFAAIYAIVIGLLVYKEFTWKKFVRTLEDTALDIGMIMLLIALSAIFSYGLTWEQIPQKMAALLLNISETPWIIMLILIVFLLIVGMFMDSTVLILLLTSILIPVAVQLNIDLVHFGIVMVLTLTIGLLTPPVGVVMYIVCSIFETSFWRFIKESWLLLLSVLLVVIAVIFIPDLTLFIPNLIFGK
ncbi:MULTISPECIES: TRAP transporter large permease [Paenibacillus]|uniref:Membrane protein n=1 Tax=Paenibacillus naphthalenovorans TaxID=162209 RepID=A0A0U2L0M1_9BACL|nr:MULTISPECIES: TRAP transporter large permease [Paenibacillus]ALS23042.1 membrane protein [Paenibacillus naphthalenovorans]GCL71897.1 TRAP transporter large permease [Paenibacillus naphthalenovorans]SDI41930.1 TRAP transporter, DctM subunit [Paenibacillus naphthalenovorans]